MAKLSAAKRKSMPKGEFAGPGRSFPVNDKKHARLAISGATRSEHAGNISVSEENHIKAAARKELGHSPHSAVDSHCGGMHCEGKSDYR